MNKQFLGLNFRLNRIFGPDGGGFGGAVDINSLRNSKMAKENKVNQEEYFNQVAKVILDHGLSADEWRTQEAICECVIQAINDVPNVDDNVSTQQITEVAPFLQDNFRQLIESLGSQVSHQHQYGTGKDEYILKDGASSSPDSETNLIQIKNARRWLGDMSQAA